ncbi:MAG: sortase [Actinomycetes bacterium]
MTADRSAPTDGDPDDVVAADDVSESPQGVSARVVVLGVVLAVLGLWALDVYAVPVAARVRQRHLSDEFIQPASRVRVGDAALQLQIPALRINETVVKGATPRLLQGGPGWREGSASPGAGNTVVLGRSTRWSHPFARLTSLQVGASVFVRTRDGRVYRYRVRTVRKLSSSTTNVMRASTQQRLTLVTSAGGPFETGRTVVVATAVGAVPDVPTAFRERTSVSADVGPFDERSAGGLLLLLAGLVIVAVAAVAAGELRRRYTPATVVLVAAPAALLGVVLVLFHLDAFIPITF